MARTSRSKAKKQPAKRQAGKSAKSRAPARKAARKAPARKGKPAPRPAAKAKVAARRSPRPQRAPRTDEVREQVARHRPTPPGSKVEAQAEHDHQDPRLAGIPGVSPEGTKVQAENYGQFKNKAVARLDKPQNWFRRAAKPKQ